MDKSGTNTEHSVWFYLHNAHEEAKVIYGNRNLNCDYSCGDGK